MESSRILLVEDEQDLGRILKQFLDSSGFDTHWLETGTEVVNWVKAHNPDLILLDLMLPGVDGLTLTQQIRTFSQVPIILVTAKTQEMDRLLGLQMGVDDYVCKPYSAPELVLRVKAVLRRAQGGDNPLSDSPPGLELNEDSLTVSFLTRHTDLTLIEFNLLKLLTDRPNRIFSREQIINSVYSDYREVSYRTVDSHVKNLRRKMANIGADKSLIESVYGAGYRFNQGIESCV